MYMYMYVYMCMCVYKEGRDSLDNSQIPEEGDERKGRKKRSKEVRKGRREKMSRKEQIEKK